MSMVRWDKPHGGKERASQTQGPDDGAAPTEAEVANQLQGEGLSRRPHPAETCQARENRVGRKVP